MSGADDSKQDAANTLIIDTIYRLTQAMVSDTENALAAGKDLMLERAIIKALQQKNDECLGLVLQKCYDMDDTVAMEFFNSIVERHTMVAPLGSKSPDVGQATSYIFTIPVTLARKNNDVQPVFTKDESYNNLLQSISDLFPVEQKPLDVFLSDYLYHPCELQDIDPSDLYGFHQGLIDHREKEHDPEIVKQVLCRYGWPQGVSSGDIMSVDLFFLIGSIVIKGEVEEPFMEVSDEDMIAWRGDAGAILEDCLKLQKDESFVMLGDVDLYYPALRNGAIEHKEFSFDLDIENVIMRDKFPPQALAVLITQFGDDDIVSQIHVTVVSILDNVVRTGFVYGLESFESTDDVIDNMIDALKDWDITRIQVMDTLLPLEQAETDGEPLFLLPEQSGMIAPMIEIDGKKERLLH